MDVSWQKTTDSGLDVEVHRTTQCCLVSDNDQLASWPVVRARGPESGKVARVRRSQMAVGKRGLAGENPSAERHAFAHRTQYLLYTQ
jgi:hypothetical protein